MITLFIIGMLVLMIKLILLAIRATWGIFKILFWILGLPALIVGLFIYGIVNAAFPLLILALILAFVLPDRKRG